MAAERGQAGIEMVALLPCLLCSWPRSPRPVCSPSAPSPPSARPVRVRVPSHAALPPGEAVRAVLPGQLARAVRVRVGADGAVEVTLAVPRVLPLPGLTVAAVER